MSYISTVAPGGGGGTSNVSGNVVNISGQVVSERTYRLDVNVDLTLTTASGGTSLGSISINGIVLSAPSANSGDVRIGGVSGEDPTTVKGLALAPGTSISMPGITSKNQLRAVATVSGDKLTHVAFVNT